MKLTMKSVQMATFWKNKLELVILQLYPQIVILIKVDILAMKIWALGEIGQKLYASWLKDVNILYYKIIV